MDLQVEHSILQGEKIEFDSDSILEKLEHFSKTQPQHPAVECGLTNLTYKEIDELSNQLANHLSNESIGETDRIGVIVEPSVNIIIAILGIFKIGGVYIPIDPTFPKNRTLTILEEINPSCILCNTNHSANLGSHGDKVSTFDDDLSNIKKLPVEFNRKKTNLESDSHIFFTSGTTGNPKGVLSLHKNLKHYLQSAQHCYRFTPHDKFIAAAKFTFSISLFELLLPIFSGSTLRILPKEDVLDLEKLSNHIKWATTFHLGPSILKKILPFLEKKITKENSYSNIRHASSGGDMIPPETLTKLTKIFPNADIFVIYGSSEISCMGCKYFIDRKRKVSKTFVGTPHANVAVMVVDSNGNLVKRGEKGDIIYSGNGLTQGYLNREDLTKEKFYTENNIRHYRIGDVGIMHKDGNLEVLGRKDYQIQINGIRIELGELDFYLRQIPGVADAVAWTDDSTDEKILTCYLVPNSQKISINEARNHLESMVPEYMVPRIFMTLPALPLNHNMKIDRSALPAPSKDNILRISDFREASSKTEKELLSIWQRILPLGFISVDDDFFLLGGSSINCIELMQLIEKEMKLTLHLNVLLENKTIYSLAKKIDFLKNNGIIKGAIPLNDNPENNTKKKVLFFIHDGNGDILPYKNLAKKIQADYSSFGITPKSSYQLPSINFTFEEIIDDYATEIQAKNIDSEIIIAGLCIGGFIAYCVAAELQKRGEHIDRIILFDSHHLDATPRKNYYTSQRLERLKSIKNNHLISKAFIVLKKSINYLRYITSNKIQIYKRKTLISICQKLTGHLTICRMFSKNLSMDDILRFAEKKYKERPRFLGNITLFKATKKLTDLDHLNINDTPYSEIFENNNLGWDNKFDGELTTIIVPAGHSTQLIDPYVEVIANNLLNQENE